MAPEQDAGRRRSQPSAQPAHPGALPEPQPLSHSLLQAGVLGAFRHRNFRLYWIGMILSVVAINMEFVALSWLVLQLTDSPMAIGITGLMNSAPIIALNLVGGAIADRINRQRLIVALQAAATLCYVVLAPLVLSGWVQFWHILVFAFAVGTARALDGPARMAMLPQLVPRQDIPSAVALSSLVWQLPRLIGPALAGVLIAAAGVGPALCVCGLGTVGAAALFGALRLVDLPSSSEGNVLHNIAEGLAYIRGNPVISALIGMTFFNSVFGMSYVLMEAVFARDVLHVGSEGFGVMETAGAVGAIGGVVIAAYASRVQRKGTAILGGAVVLGLCLIGFACSTWYPLSLLFLTLCGMVGQMYMTVIITAMQLTVPDAVRGRVVGLFVMNYSLMPLGGTIVGGLAERLGAPAAVSLGGLLVALMASVVALRVPLLRALR